MSATLSDAGRVAFQLAFQASPIILSQGIAADIPGGYLPIIALTEAVSILNGAFTGTFPNSLDNLFAQFVPIQGGTIISQQIGMYPFANQQVAANAVIATPLTISMAMIAPVRDPGGYVAKIATFTALQAALAQHNNIGGTYVICTPAFIYNNCVMTGMTDITPPDTKQPQVQWQLDFIQPLLSQSAAAQALNSLMQKITAGSQINGQPTYSGLSTGVGTPLAGTATSILGTNVGNYLPIPVTQTPLP